MKFLVVLSAALAVAVAKPGYIGSPLAYSTLGYHGLGYNGIANPLGYAGYAGYAGYGGYSGYAPLAIHSQYHAQDVLGQASYGHVEPYQTHNAVQDAAGNKVGSYSYISPEGKVIKTDYIADAAGFRVASNALPVAPVAAPVALPVGPTPVQDTPEVVEARNAHLAAVQEVKSRSRRATPASTSPLVVPAPTVYNYPFTYNAAVPHAYAYSAIPTFAVRDATLTTVVNNPGHAISYTIA